MSNQKNFRIVCNKKPRVNTGFFCKISVLDEFYFNTFRPFHHVALEASVFLLLSFRKQQLQL